MIISNNEFQLLNLEGKVIGLTSGCFDLLHFYHLRYLERCKALCDILIVGVDSDLLVYANKNKYPVIPEHHRLSMIDALKCVDITFKMDSLKDLINKFSLSNKLFKNGTSIYGEEVKMSSNLELVIVPDIEEVNSTTNLISKIKNNGN
ncbi:hypothetical protein DAC20_10 [Bacteroides phage DAC20]|nr:hypothetical protein DAC19_10 [Bacteroides phage DAC19]QIG63763.1 hypothetical protein DAC20_10 [Bacteroides phage DAC20]QIG64024.1 hypothetical protein DAC22_10 [Bacteroides phage DAC22]